mmetsp:Transcript_78440/g.197041  ORF Transcript_78440/g.197041 Transcript_78440/m.197041 type:complete len:1135 (+) Transcript_78440:164-3568(+)|eukprot:CAMPEP_0115174448 /NCGR_PEP_ID=MMETSP0270-20121206/3843_1 /TAXON_ID=71861 /ORGANISM="Scrippsiella trochoidea, Strain CCMP3099" /LENGTH=1134 /DNA_ID=CAMNT_0002587285 /DNA_START=109 /DNA_END=3513 /DNA_ORIENTATION=+
MWVLLAFVVALAGSRGAATLSSKTTFGSATCWLVWATPRYVVLAKEHGSDAGDQAFEGHDTDRHRHQQDTENAESGSHQALAFEPWRAVGDIAGSCSDRFSTPGGPPEHATDFNGLTLPDVCFPGHEPHHIFVIGDWGGVYRDANTPVRPADRRTKHLPGQHRPFVFGADDRAQQNVAKQMKARSLKHSPDFVVNVGDNFYWGGILEECGRPPREVGDPSGQWLHVFEKMYDGIGLAGKQWLGVLGNHDFGGFTFTSGWDQAIGYTWSNVASSTGRWMTPALYYSSTVRYSDFSVDWFFVDSNYFDAYNPDMDENHNLCSEQHNQKHATCGVQGPGSVNECPRWFERLWKAQVAWLEKGLEKSLADWQIVVTHFPPEHGIHTWKKLTRDHGIDLIITGHRHQQEVHYLEDSNFLKPTAFIVSGGGGGITSEGVPVANGTDDQYGFMDLTLSRAEIMIEAISHGGQIRSTTCILQRTKGGFARKPLSSFATKSLCAGRPSVAQETKHEVSTATQPEDGGDATQTLFQAPNPSKHTVSGTVTTSVWAPWPTSQKPTSTSTATATLTQTSTRTRTTSTLDPDIPLQCDVALLLTVNNVMYDWLLISPEQLRDFKAVVATAVAPFAGNGVKPKDVYVELSVGSVLVRATVSISSCVAARLVRYRLISSPALGNTVAWLIANIQGIENLAVGTISVTNVRVSAVEEMPVQDTETRIPASELAMAALAKITTTSTPLPSTTTGTTINTTTTSSSSTLSSSSVAASSSSSRVSSREGSINATTTPAAATYRNSSNAHGLTNATSSLNTSAMSLVSNLSNISSEFASRSSNSSEGSLQSGHETGGESNSSDVGGGGNESGKDSEAERRRKHDCHVIVLMRVNQVELDSLSNRSSLLESFKVSIASALAVVAGNWIDPEHVELVLKPGAAKGHSHGFVAVRAKIGRPSFVSASWVQSTLSESVSLEETVADMVSSIEGIQEVSSARITVGDVRIYRGDGSKGSPCSGPITADPSSPVVSAVALPPRPAAGERLPERERFGGPADSALDGGSSDAEELAIFLTAFGILAACIPYCFWRRRQDLVSYSELMLVTAEEGRPFKAFHAASGPWVCVNTEDADEEDAPWRSPPEEALLGPDEPLLRGL